MFLTKLAFNILYFIATGGNSMLLSFKLPLVSSLYYPTKTASSAHAKCAAMFFLVYDQ